VRVWHLALPPGGWLTFHRHVLDYFWTTPTAGIARGYYEDGRIVDVHHYPGETRHFRHGLGEYFVHAIENVGDTPLRILLALNAGIYEGIELSQWMGSSPGSGTKCPLSHTRGLMQVIDK